MCAFTRSRSEKMESLSAEGLAGVKIRVFGRQAGGGLSTLAGQNTDEWGWVLVLVRISWSL